MPKYDAGTGITGATTGAQIGTAISPGVGTAVGAVIGAAGGFFGGKARKKKKPKTYSTLDPTQQQLYGDYAAAVRGEGPFGDLYNYDPIAANDVFERNIARPAYRSYQENIVPQITGQYRGGNIMNSTYSAEALSRAGRDVQEGLNAQRAQYLYSEENRAKQNKMNAINDILNRQTFAYESPDSNKGVVDQILSALGPQAGEWFADYLKNKRTSKPTLPQGGSGASFGATGIGA